MFGSETLDSATPSLKGESAEDSRYETVKGFCQFSTVGGVEDYDSRGEYDYYTFPLK